MPTENVEDRFRVVTWNIGGAKYLEFGQRKRESFKDTLHANLGLLLTTYKPDLILFQEAVRTAEAGLVPTELIDSEKISENLPEKLRYELMYHYSSSVAIDTENQKHPQKWAKYFKNNRWKTGSYLAQGYGILWKSTLCHAAIWDTEAHSGPEIQKEVVRIETGLFTGSRDTEPRIAVVSHFIVTLRGKPLDIFVVNLHLTTLKQERQGSPARDSEGSQIRLAQLGIITTGIVSRFNEWAEGRKEYKNRWRPLWIMGGDFNCMPSAPELRMLKDMNFIDLNPNKGSGTKGKGIPLKKATITLDYLFAGPAYYSIDPFIATKVTENNPLPLNDFAISDHFPVMANVPIMPSP